MEKTTDPTPAEIAAYIKPHLRTILDTADAQLVSGIYYGDGPGETSGGWRFTSPPGDETRSFTLLVDNPCGYWCGEEMHVIIHPRIVWGLFFSIDDDAIHDSTPSVYPEDEMESAILKHNPEIEQLMIDIARKTYDFSVNSE